MALVAWPAVGANSYSSRADADTYFADQLNTAVWDAATDADKDKALITATRLLDRETWQGDKTDPDQPLAFPRTGLTDLDGDALPDDELPGLFLQGFWELAQAILGDVKLMTSGSTASNIQSVKAGSAGVTFFRPNEGTRWPDWLQTLFGPFMLSAVSGVAGAVAFGLGRESVFSEDGDFGVNDGY